ncbi:MAG TPA: hypothetical protein VHX42_04255, partial [Candidatus Babeliales bacterium]|nr:hypothetical protein [Candidatus Babeliales bacterium]
IKDVRITHQKSLSLEQNRILEKLSYNKPQHLQKFGELYTFSSQKDYEIFVTLPKELREQIVDPLNKVIGVIQHPKWYNNTIPKYMGTVIQLKWIIPENENKKKHLPKILIRQDTWCCCG